MSDGAAETLTLIRIHNLLPLSYVIAQIGPSMYIILII